MSLTKKDNLSIPSPLLTKRETSEFLRISRWTLGKLRVPTVAIGGRQFYRRSDLEKFIETNVSRER